MCGPETPRRAVAGNPEYAGSETAAMVFTAHIEVGVAAEEGEDFVPLAGCQFQICHAVSDNTKCQHGLMVYTICITRCNAVQDGIRRSIDVIHHPFLPTPSFG